MRTHTRTRLPLTLVAATVLLGACADSDPIAPGEEPLPAVAVQAMRGQSPDAVRLLATMARATARYHDIDAARMDGFVFLHGCETRGEEGPVGMVFVHMGRLTDGVIDAAKPEALIYEPRAKGQPKLIGVELAVPYALASTPPKFLGNTFQAEDEFGVWGLHVWLWTQNPEGLFAESNPRITCGA